MLEATRHHPALPASRSRLALMGFLFRYSNPLTRKSYARTLDQFFAFCEQNQIEPIDAQRIHIEAWARSLELGYDGHQPNQKATIAVKLTALHGFYDFAVKDDLIPKSPMVHVNRPKIPRQTTTNYLTRGEMVDILNHAERHSPRAHALVCVLGLNGLRISEALDINIEDLTTFRSYLRVKVRRRKNDRQQWVTFSMRTMWALTTYIADRTAGPLFTSRTGRRINRQEADRIVKLLCRRAGITKRISPHSFRHTFATLYLDAGGSERDLQHSGAWADSRMVAYYDHGGDRPERNATHLLTAFIEGAA